MIAIPTKQKSSLLTIIFITGALISFICGFYTLFSFIQSRRIQQNRLLVHAKQKSDSTADTINKFIDQLAPLATATATKLSNGTLNQESTQQIEKELQQKPVEVSGLGIVFSTNKAPEATYYVEHDDKQQLVPLMNFNTFAAQESWYKKTMQSSGGYFGLMQDPVTNQKIILYAVPFYANTKKDSALPAGVVFATLSLDHIQHVISTLYVGQEGYSYIVDQKGQIIIHPYAHNQDSQAIRQRIDSIKNNIPLSPIKEALNNTNTPITYYDSIIKESSWLFARQIPITRWVLISSFDKHTLAGDTDSTRRQLSVILLYFLLGLFLLVCVIPTLYFYDDRMLWLSSGLTAFIFLIGIAIMWYLAIRYPSYNKQLIPITSKSELYRFLDAFKETKTMPAQKKDITQADTPMTETKDKADLLRYRYKEGKYIPTGFLINDVHLSGVDQIEFVGYIWQRYFDGIHDGVSRGFIFPQMADTPTINQISDIKQGNRQTIIWQVRSKLNQEMNYSKYPFDTKNIQIQIRHKDFEKNSILVPDLDAYDIINPNALPGIAQTTHMTGWYMIQSFFGYELSNYTTNFGLYSYGPFGMYDVTQLDNPELYFNVNAGRYLIDTIVTNLLVLVLIALILFILLLIYSLEGFGWIIGTVTGTLFSTILAQVNFRSKVPSQTFVYFEMFYFVFYFIIMLTLISSLLHQFKVDIRLISYRKNIITKILYCPLLFGLIFAATVYYLY